MEYTCEEKAKLFKAFCDSHRQEILDFLKDGEKCVCKLVEKLKMPQSSLSYHLKILCDSGVIKGHEVGKWTHYEIDKAALDRAIEILNVLKQKG